MPEKIYKIIDNHVHIAGPGKKYDKDLYWSEKFEDGRGYKSLVFFKGWKRKEVTDQLMIDTLETQANDLLHVNAAVVLAFDEVYDVDGAYRGRFQEDISKDLSTLFVSNKFVTETLCNNNPNLIPGISVHPFRDKAVDVLAACSKDAVLCKWMASAQLIDMEGQDKKKAEDPPLDERERKLDEFYDKLVELGLPLLYHTGVETSIPAVEDWCEKYNSPIYMKRALDRGVTVILAHCGCSYFDFFPKQKNVVKETVEMFKRMEENKAKGIEWRLYADISALFSPFRKNKILKRVFDNLPRNRLIYGSDFPNPAKGRKESCIQVFLKYAKRNLLNQYFKITLKWFKKFKFTPKQTQTVLTNFHQVLDDLGRGHIIDKKGRDTLPLG